MKILAIETSCDDTGIAILDIKGNQTPEFNVLSNVIASQIEVHKKYGGVFPAMAKREHEKNLAPTFKTALKEANVLEKDIDLIAVTNGPGLEPCLWVGVNFAKNLAKKWGIPLVPVNHIEGHILVNFLFSPVIPAEAGIQFPAIALVVSGGHTQLILMRGIGKYEILGETRDDAAGECFDKCAKILGLSYPGGPIIAELSQKAGGTTYIPPLPRPMMHTKDYDFSFSGLKTAVLYSWEKIKKERVFVSRQKADQLRAQFAKEIQQAIIDVLLKKTIKAAKDFKAKTIILGGGVSANEELRRQFQNAVNRHCEGETRSNLNLIFPPANLSTDNGLMIALAGFYNKKNAKNPSTCSGQEWHALKADANLRIGK